MTGDDNLKENPDEGEQTGGCSSKRTEYLSKRQKVWFIAIVSMSLTIISAFGYYDMAPTVLFDPPNGHYVNTTLVTSNQTFTSEIVQKEAYQNNSGNNSNIYVNPDKKNTVSIKSLPPFAYLSGIVAFSAWISNKVFEQTKRRAISSLVVPVAFFVFMMVLSLIGYGASIEGSLCNLTLLSYLGMTLLLLFLFLVTYSAHGDPNPLPQKGANETIVNLYTNKLSRTAQGILSVGLAITIGGVISYGIGGSTSTRVIPIIFLSGIILMPTLGIVTILHLKSHWIEQSFREHELSKDEEDGEN